MIKNIAFLLVSFLCQNSFAQTAYRIEGQIKGLKSGNCILANYLSTSLYSKDTAQADANGNIVFEGKTPLPGGLYEVVLPDLKTLVRLVIANEQQFSFVVDTADVIGSIKVKNGRDTELFYDFQRFMKNKEEQAQALRAAKPKDLDKKIKDLQDQRKAFYDQFMMDNANSFAVKLFKTSAEPELPPAPKLPNGKIDSVWQFNYYKAHFWDNFDFADERLLRTPFLQQKLERYFKELTVQVEDSLNKEVDYVVGKAIAGKQKSLIAYTIDYPFSEYQNPKIVGTEGVFVYVAEKYYYTGIMPLSDTSSLRQIKDRVNTLKPLLVGRTIPDLGVQGEKDNMTFIHGMRGSYNVVFIYSPTCGHCRESAPKLKAFYDKYRAQGVEIMTIATEGTPEDWKKFIKEMKWENLNNGYGLVANRQVNYNKDYDVFSTPTVYVLDKNKKIIARRIGTEDLEPFLKLYQQRTAFQAKATKTTK
jgi:thiol-disulfide isomerase/thioredoxin